MCTRRDILATLPALTGCAEPTAERRGRSSQEGKVEQGLFNLLNVERKRKGLKPLSWHAAAAEVARSHSRAMARGTFFSHTDPQGRNTGDRLSSVGIRWRAVGENIYMQTGFSDPVRRAVEGWMKSAGHRKNILSEVYTHTGIGVVAARDGTAYYTQVFLTPA